MEQRLLKENVFKALMIFALPYMFSNLLQVLYGSVDLFVVGQFGHTFDILSRFIENDWWSYCFIFNRCFRFNFCDVVF